MSGRQRRQHTGRYREIMNDWYCDSSYMIMSTALWNLENFRCLIFVVECVHCMNL